MRDPRVGVIVLFATAPTTSLTALLGRAKGIDISRQRYFIVQNKMNDDPELMAVRSEIERAHPTHVVVAIWRSDDGPIALIRKREEAHRPIAPEVSDPPG